MRLPSSGLLLLAWAAVGCGSDPIAPRTDGGEALAIDLEGSLQNPAWAPGSDGLVFTRFRDGYNAEPADVYVVGVDGTGLRALVKDGSGNVNLPGSAWNASTGQIVFSSSREPHDEIYVIDADGSPGDERAVTNRSDHMAYEPSFSPDGEWVVFESHELEQEGHGVITRARVDGSGSATALTDADDDCRQPNWSPAGDLILYQRHEGGSWDIWVMDADGAHPRQLTSEEGDATDASFSPDGSRIVYSADGEDLDLANLFVMNVSGGDPQRVTRWGGYDGAPSWSPDGKLLAFESVADDPDDSDGTSLVMIEAPE